MANKQMHSLLSHQVRDEAFGVLDHQGRQHPLRRFNMISVIIPVFNDPDGLGDTLESLLSQEYPPDAWEAIIADNGSTNPTIEVARAYEKRSPKQVRLTIEDQIRGSYAARNRGIMEARGEIICFIDADVTVPHDYLSWIDDAFQDSGVHYVGGEIKIALTKPTLAGKYDCAYSFFDSKRWMVESHWSATANLAVRRKVLDDVGLFDARLESGGDTEFGQRVFEAGYRQIYASWMVVTHPARDCFSELLKKDKRLARGNAELAYYYPDRYSHFRKKHIRLGRFIPGNPFAACRTMLARGVPISILESMFLSCFKTYSRLMAALSFVNRTRQLRATNRTPRPLKH